MKDNFKERQQLCLKPLPKSLYTLRQDVILMDLDVVVFTICKWGKNEKKETVVQVFTILPKCCILSMSMIGECRFCSFSSAISSDSLTIVDEDGQVPPSVWCYFTFD